MSIKITVIVRRLLGPISSLTRNLFPTLSSLQVLLMLASQRIETVMGGWFWESSSVPADDMPTKRGSTPTFVEWLILGWVSGLIWSEVKQLWDVGLQEYVHDMWNVIDFVTNSLYVATVALRIVSYFQVRPNSLTGN